MFRVGIITNKGTIGKTFENRGQAETFILQIADNNDDEKVKRADIIDRKTGKRERIF